jgi:hypothetical protein
LTNAVVAICVVVVPVVAVGATGVPVKIGEASGANPLLTNVDNEILPVAPATAVTAANPKYNGNHVTVGVFCEQIFNAPTDVSYHNWPTNGRTGWRLLAPFSNNLTKLLLKIEP